MERGDEEVDGTERERGEGKEGRKRTPGMGMMRSP
jgi:hypothetical protein